MLSVAGWLMYGSTPLSLSLSLHHAAAVAVAQRYVAPPEERAALAKAVGRVFQGSCALLAEDHRALGEQEQENTRIVNRCAGAGGWSEREMPQRDKERELQREGFAPTSHCLPFCPLLSSSATCVQRDRVRGRERASEILSPLLALPRCPSPLSRGDLPADVAAEYEKRRKAYEALHRAVASLAESLDQPMPELVEDAFTRLGGAEQQQQQQPGAAQAQVRGQAQVRVGAA